MAVSPLDYSRETAPPPHVQHYSNNTSFTHTNTGPRSSVQSYNAEDESSIPDLQQRHPPGQPFGAQPNHSPPLKKKEWKRERRSPFYDFPAALGAPAASQFMCISDLPNHHYYPKQKKPLGGTRKTAAKGKREDFAALSAQPAR